MCYKLLSFHFVYGTSHRQAVQISGSCGRLGSVHPSAGLQLSIAQWEGGNQCARPCDSLGDAGNMGFYGKTSNFKMLATHSKFLSTKRDNT